MMVMMMTMMNGNTSNDNNKMQAHIKCKAISKYFQMKLKYLQLNTDKHHRGQMWPTVMDAVFKGKHVNKMIIYGYSASCYYQLMHDSPPYMEATRSFRTSGTTASHPKLESSTTPLCILQISSCNHVVSIV
jgi:hypothetical protein